MTPSLPPIYTLGGSARLLARRAAAYEALLILLEPSPRMELMLRFIAEGSIDSQITPDEARLAAAALKGEVPYHASLFSNSPLWTCFLDDVRAQDQAGADPVACSKSDMERLGAPLPADGIHLWYESPGRDQLIHVAVLGRDPDDWEEAEKEWSVAEQLATLREEDARQGESAGQAQGGGARSAEGARPGRRRGRDVVTLIALPDEQTLTDRLDQVVGPSGWSVCVLPNPGSYEAYEAGEGDPFFVRLSIGLGVSLVAVPGSDQPLQSRYLGALFRAASSFGIGARMGHHSPLRLRPGEPVLEQARRELIRRRAVTDESPDAAS